MTLHIDNFNRSDTAAGAGLGTFPSGPAWQHLRGSWRILSNQAYAGTVADAIAVVDLLGPDAAEVKVDISGSGGDALYFRVVDANNWWRVRYRRYTTSSSYPIYTTEYQWQKVTTTYTTEYQWMANPGVAGGAASQQACIDTGGSATHSHVDTRYGWGSYSVSPWGTYVSEYHSHARWQGSSCGVDYGGHYHNAVPSKTGSTRQVGTSSTSYYWSTSSSNPPVSGATLTGQTRTTQTGTGTSTNTHYRVILERSVGGSITTIGSTNLSSPPNQLIASAEDTSVKYGYRRGTTVTFPVSTYTNTSHLTASKYGIGRGPSEVTGTALDNFSVDVNNSPPNAPTGLSSNAITVSPSQDITFVWVPSDPDFGDTVTGFDLRYRVQGTSVWSTVERRGTPTTQHVLEADTLFSGETYDWEVRTYDAVNAAGEWATAFFFAAEDDSINNVTPTESIAISTQGSVLVPSSAFMTMYTNVFGEVNPSPDAIMTMYQNVSFPADPSPDAVMFMQSEVVSDFPTPHIWYMLPDRAAGTLTIIGRGFRSNQSGGRVWWGRGTDAEKLLEVISWSRVPTSLSTPAIDASSSAGTTVGHEEIVVRLPPREPGTYDVMVETDSGVVVEATLKYSGYTEGYEI